MLDSTITINLDCTYERDMDLMLMRILSYDAAFLSRLFLSQIGFENCDIDAMSISHSVFTEDGETDIEVILTLENGRRVALLLEDKIDAQAMDQQSGRYHIRGDKAVKDGRYDEYHVFIVAPQQYLDTNAEAGKYPHRISYETLREHLTDPFEKAVIDKALEGYGGVKLARNQQVTAFWDKVYDYVDENFSGVFRIDGERGLPRSGLPGQWITIRCNNKFEITIKSDRGYADLEIKNYADKFETFCKDNKALIDEEKLFIRTASKSLAIRKYIAPIDFTMPFETQEPALRTAFDAAKELQELVHLVKVR